MQLTRQNNKSRRLETLSFAATSRAPRHGRARPKLLVGSRFAKGVVCCRKPLPFTGARSTLPGACSTHLLLTSSQADNSLSRCCIQILRQLSRFYIRRSEKFALWAGYRYGSIMHLGRLGHLAWPTLKCSSAEHRMPAKTVRVALL